MWLTLREKIVFVNICSLLLIIKNICLKKSKFSSRFPLFKFVKKNKLSEYFCDPFGDNHFFD